MCVCVGGGGGGTLSVVGGELIEFLIENELNQHFFSVRFSCCIGLE